MKNESKVVHAVLVTNKITHSAHISAFYETKESAERAIEETKLSDEKGGPNPYEYKICSKRVYS